MFSLDTNLAGVIRQVEQLQRAIPQALGEALAPALWQGPARAVAERVLLATAAPSERQYIRDFVDTVLATVFGGDGVQVKMESPFPKVRDILAEARVAKALTDPNDLGLGLFNLPVNEFETLIHDWVATEQAAGGKARDQRDLGKSDEEIAHLISYIMLAPQLGMKGLKARDALLPHIRDFLAKTQQQKLSAEVVDRWLRAVLPAWRALFQEQYPMRVREILHAKKGALFL